MIGIIGGSGFYSLSGETPTQSVDIQTPFAEPPVTVHRESLGDNEVLFLPRHGTEHGIPPHKVNYRANLYALKESGATHIIAVNVVGGITDLMAPGTLVIPDQVIDYTWGRAHTFFDALDAVENHIDFTWPYDATLRETLVASVAASELACIDKGVYGCTQGPRLETAAEIQRLKRDGCDIVGMTGMPEAALARELQIPYASICLVVNWAAGLDSDAISFAQISAILDTGINDIRRVLQSAVK